MNLALFSEGLRMFRRNLRVKCHGFERYSGSDEEICRKIIEDCWNKEKVYFQTSAGMNSNYPEFYARDFGMCVEPLIRLGYRTQCEDTVVYAMEQYALHQKITVMITPKGLPINFPDTYSPDSVAYFFRILRITQSKKLIVRNRAFLNAEIIKFEKNVINPQKGIVAKKHFSGMRDYVIVKESCYDMIMACILCDEIEKINRMMRTTTLHNPLKKYALKKNLITYYWNGSYFKNNPTDDTLTGHCNIFPYALGIINDKKMIKKSLRAITNADLDKPFPLRYERTQTTSKFIWQEIFVSGWERDTLWTFLAMPYIEVLSKVDKKRARQELKKYRGLIEEHRGFIEVYDAGGKPYRSLFFSTETRMLWACMYLDLKKRLDLKK
ncbi:MAG: hypothetical protein WC916_00495 [Candidatus Woesearchaeota archaeon]